LFANRPGAVLDMRERMNSIGAVRNKDIAVRPPNMLHVLPSFKDMTC
jgi:hypothetical protein